MAGPPAVVTVTDTLPAAWAGAVTKIEVAVVEVGVAGVPPNETEVAVVKFVPVMTTAVPPAMEPVIGERLVMVGVPAVTVNPLVRVATSAVVVTVTSRAVVAAAPEIVMLAVACVASVTVVVLTVMPVPEKLATEVPLTKLVLVPTIATFKVAPCAPVFGVAEAKEGGA